MTKTAIHIFNGFTCNARWPSKLKTGLVCTLVQTDRGLTLIDTGPGLDDYAHPHAMLRLFQVITSVKMDPREAAINQIRQLGFNNGFVLDGFEERAFPPGASQKNPLSWGGNFSEIPPVLVARMKLQANQTS